MNEDHIEHIETELERLKELIHGILVSVVSVGTYQNFRGKIVELIDDLCETEEKD